MGANTHGICPLGVHLSFDPVNKTHLLNWTVRCTYRMLYHTSPFWILIAKSRWMIEGKLRRGVEVA